MRFFRTLATAISLFVLTAAANAAADLGNTSVISPTDASNASGTCPSWSGSAAPSTIDDSGRCLQGAIARFWENSQCTTTTTGSANAYVATYTVAPAAYRNGQVYCLKTNFANTGTATLNINSLGAKTIQKVVSGTLTNLSSGDLPSGAFGLFAYNSSADVFVWLNRADSASFYSSGGTDVALADGGTGASLTDPNADRLMFWDDSAGAVDWLTLGAAYATSTTTLRSPTESLCVAASDESTALTTGTAKVTFHMPYAFTVTAVSASINTVSSSGNPAIDINEDPDAEGATAKASILSTTITIDANERRSSTAATPAVISDTSLAANAEMSIDIDTAGTGAKGLKVCIIGYQT